MGGRALISPFWLWHRRFAARAVRRATGRD